MAKTKNPLLSLDAKGTIGDTLTFQDRGQDTIVRKKPIPANPRSLAQMYQRWLYQDYAYLWTQQTASTQWEYASAGSRYHLTAFQYWMKYHLTNLPDIAAWWKMDDNRGARTIDSSRNGNTARVVGASPVTGAIDKAFYFDGINDMLGAPHSSSLDITGDLSIEALIEPFPMAGAPGVRSIVSKGIYTQSYSLFYNTGTARFEARINNITIAQENFIIDGLWHHVYFSYEPGVGGWIWVDGVKGFWSANIGAIPSVNAPLFIADERVPTAGRNWTGCIDNLIIRNRLLDDPTIIRHSARRYPL